MLCSIVCSATQIIRTLGGKRAGARYDCLKRAHPRSLGLLNVFKLILASKQTMKLSPGDSAILEEKSLPVQSPVFLLSTKLDTVRFRARNGSA